MTAPVNGSRDRVQPAPIINQQNGVLCSLLVNLLQLISLLAQKGHEIANRIHWQFLLSKDTTLRIHPVGIDPTPSRSVF